MRRLINFCTLSVKAFKRFMCRCKCFFEVEENDSDGSESNKSDLNISDIIDTFRQKQDEQSDKKKIAWLQENKSKLKKVLGCFESFRFSKDDTDDATESKQETDENK